MLIFLLNLTFSIEQVMRIGEWICPHSPQNWPNPAFGPKGSQTTKLLASKCSYCTTSSCDSLAMREIQISQNWLLAWSLKIIMRPRGREGSRAGSGCGFQEGGEVPTLLRVGSGFRRNWLYSVSGAPSTPTLTTLLPKQCDDLPFLLLLSRIASWLQLTTN